MSVPRYLVTGGDGFIGSHLVRRLVSRGEVVVVVQPGCDLLRLGPLQKDIELCSVDVRDDVKIRELVKTARPTTIFHLAAAGMVPGKESPGDVMTVNVSGAYNILAGMLATGQVEAAVFAGSWYEYGRALTEVAAERVPQPMSVYGVSKLAATLLVQTFAARGGRAALSGLWTYGASASADPTDHEEREDWCEARAQHPASTARLDLCRRRGGGARPCQQVVVPGEDRGCRHRRDDHRIGCSADALRVDGCPVEGPEQRARGAEGEE